MREKTIPTKRKSYEKPNIHRVELLLEQAVLAACKGNNIDNALGGTGGVCSVGCSDITTT